MNAVVVGSTHTKLIYVVDVHDIHIVGNIPYKFVAICLCSNKIWVKLNHLYLLSKEDSGDGTYTKMINTHCMFN